MNGCVRFAAILRVTLFLVRQKVMHDIQGVAGFPAFTLMEFDCFSAFGKGLGMNEASSNA